MDRLGIGIGSGIDEPVDQSAVIANEEYLRRVLGWLRRTLTEVAERNLGGPTGSTTLGSTEGTKADPQGGRPVADPAEDLPATRLQLRLGLSDFEFDVLMLVAAMELEPSIASLCADAHGDHRMTYPTFSLALAIFERPSWTAVSPLGRLRYWRLLEISQSPGQPLTAAPLRADERIVSYLKGLDYLDDRLEPFLRASEPAGDAELPPSHQSVAEQVLSRWRQVAPGSPIPIAGLAGADLASKELVAGGVAAALRRHLWLLDAEALPAAPSDLEDFARLWHRESALGPVALYLDAQDGPTPRAQRFLDRAGGMLFLASRQPWPDVTRERAWYDVQSPTSTEQAAAWRQALGETADSAGIPALTGQFVLTTRDIFRIADAAHAAPPTLTAPESLSARVWSSCLAVTRPRLDMLAHRVPLAAGWSDLVLPERETALLHRIVGQPPQRSTVFDEWGFAATMNRGLGTSALFAGPSGTGKSMAAEVIAGDLGLALYRIDLAAVVSKYIGETEKNLSRLFDAAERGGAVLLFDEADALFGKRSEVKDSHDRYANIEINYLLQRMEAYRGVAILATNMRKALDTAFLRRLRFVIDFPFPPVAQRRQMWQQVFPAAAPVDQLDFDRLAALPATGGIIHNVALAAAFIAAGDRRPISMADVLEATRTEFRKTETLIVESQFAAASGLT